jgi:hypothetical protein
MGQRLSTFLIAGFLFMLAWAGNPQTGAPVLDWKGLEEAWKNYTTGPSGDGAKKVLDQLTAKVKIADVKEGSLIINKINDQLGILESEIYAGEANAVKLGFRFFSISSGPFEEALNRIIGNLIRFNARLFLEELANHRYLITSLNSIVGSFLKDFPDDPTARTLEKKLRIKALEAVEDKALKSIRNECIKILKRL